jgi:hypothetical protein
MTSTEPWMSVRTRPIGAQTHQPAFTVFAGLVLSLHPLLPGDLLMGPDESA